MLVTIEVYCVCYDVTTILIFLQLSAKKNVRTEDNVSSPMCADARMDSLDPYVNSVMNPCLVFRWWMQGVSLLPILREFAPPGEGHITSHSMESNTIFLESVDTNSHTNALESSAYP